MQTSLQNLKTNSPQNKDKNKKTKLRSIDQLKGKQFRTFSIKDNDVDTDARTVSVAFSSETPVSRWYGDEVLDHSPGSVDLSFFESGAPVLRDHDPAQQIGIVEKVSIDNDRRGRATLRISRSAEPDWLDIQDGIKRHISVGYQIDDVAEEPNDVYRVRWSPFEISFVSLPADRNVGVGRSQSLQNSSNSLNPGEPQVTTEQETKQTEDAKVEKSATKIDIQDKKDNRADDSMTEILRIGEQLGETQFAREFSLSGKTTQEFRDALRSKFAKNKSNSSSSFESRSHLDMPKSDIRKYSWLKAIRASVNNNWDKAGLEWEANKTIAERLDREPRGFFVPLEIQQRSTNPDIFDSNLQSVVNPEHGGHLVKTNLLTGSFIDILRDCCILNTAGITILNNLHGIQAIPKQTDSSKGVFIDEDGEAPDSKIKFGMISLAPKTIAVAVPMTRKVLKHASMDLERLVVRDIAINNALAIDEAGLMGSGDNNEPLGLLNQPGLKGLTFNSTQENQELSYRHIVKLKETLKKQKTLSGKLVFLGDPGMESELTLTEKSKNTAQFLLNGNKLIGYRFEASNQLPEGVMIFGDFSQLVMGMWGVLDILPDTATKVASGGLVIRTFQDIDFGVRHIESFAILADEARPKDDFDFKFTPLGRESKPRFYNKVDAKKGAIAETSSKATKKKESKVSL